MLRRPRLTQGCSAEKMDGHTDTRPVAKRRLVLN